MSFHGRNSFVNELSLTVINGARLLHNDGLQVLVRDSSRQALT